MNIKAVNFIAGHWKSSEITPGPPTLIVALLVRIEGCVTNARLRGIGTLPLLPIADLIWRLV